MAKLEREKHVITMTTVRSELRPEAGGQRALPASIGSSPKVPRNKLLARFATPQRQHSARFLERQRRHSMKSKLAPEVDREAAELERLALSGRGDRCVLKRLIDRNVEQLRGLDTLAANHLELVQASSEKSLLNNGGNHLRIRAVRRFAENGLASAKTEIERLEILSTAFHALIEALPVAGEILYSVKRIYDRLVLEGYAAKQRKLVDVAAKHRIAVLSGALLGRVEMCTKPPPLVSYEVTQPQTGQPPPLSAPQPSISVVSVRESFRGIERPITSAATPYINEFGCLSASSVRPATSLVRWRRKRQESSSTNAELSESQNDVPPGGLLWGVLQDYSSLGASAQPRPVESTVAPSCGAIEAAGRGLLDSYSVHEVASETTAAAGQALAGPSHRFPFPPATESLQLRPAFALGSCISGRGSTASVSHSNSPQYHRKIRTSAAVGRRQPVAAYVLQRPVQLRSGAARTLIADADDSIDSTLKGWVAKAAELLAATDNCEQVSVVVRQALPVLTIAMHEVLRKVRHKCADWAALGTLLWRHLLAMIKGILRAEAVRRSGTDADIVELRISLSALSARLDHLRSEQARLLTHETKRVLEEQHNLTVSIKSKVQYLKRQRMTLRTLEEQIRHYSRKLKLAEREGRLIEQDELLRLAQSHRCSLKDKADTEMGERERHERDRQATDRRRAVEREHIANSRATLQSLESVLPLIEEKVAFLRRKTRDACVQARPAEFMWKVENQSKKKWTRVRNKWKLKKRRVRNVHIPPSFQHVVKLVPASYKPKPLVLKTARRLVVQIYLEHVQAQQALHDQQTGSGSARVHANIGLESLVEFSYDFFVVKYGLPQLSELRLVDFLVSCRKHAPECIGLRQFCRFIGVAPNWDDSNSPKGFNPETEGVANTADTAGDVGADAGKEAGSMPSTAMTSGEAEVDEAQKLHRDREAELSSYEALIFFLRAFTSVRGKHHGHTYIEDPDDSRLFALLEPARVGLRPVFDFLTETQVEDIVSRVMSHQTQLKITDRFVGAKKVQRGRGGLVHVVNVDQMMETVLKEWLKQTRKIKKRLEALFVAGDINEDRILSYAQFNSVVRAADPNISKHQVASMYREALQHGDNSETVDLQDFVAVTHAHGLMSPVAWHSAELGLAKIGPAASHTDSAYDEEKRSSSLELLVESWSTSKPLLEADLLKMEKAATTPSKNWEVMQHRERINHFERLVISRDVAAEAAWQAFRLLMYEIDKTKRTAQTELTFTSLRFMMRWKLKMKRLLRAREGGGFLDHVHEQMKLRPPEHPIFSKCRWRRIEEFHRLLGAPDFDINISDSCKNNLLHIAVQNGHQDFAESLIAKGIELDAQNITGQTALHFAKFYDYKAIFYLLKRSGANDKLRNNDGRTCYMVQTASQ